MTKKINQTKLFKIISDILLAIKINEYLKEYYLHNYILEQNSYLGIVLFTIILFIFRLLKK
ncbi:hypothetical protein [Poseidonibacter sp.]|uniref:hypothetical protein n=1 Tax=Poseidonibacter sp. TaxID=2321188 RepID=UPI003C776A96